MLDDLRHLPKEDAFQIIREERAGMLLLILVVCAIIFDMVPR